MRILRDNVCLSFYFGVCLEVFVMFSVCFYLQGVFNFKFTI
jgi:hypothetical protein